MAERTAQYTYQMNNVSVVYNTYRIVLPLVLLVTYISSPGITRLGALAPTLFVQVTTAYAIFGVGITFSTPAWIRLLEKPNILVATLVIDILAITLIIYTSGGTTGGLGLLLIVTIASGSILIRGRISTFLAAIAALSLIYTELYLSLSLEDPPNGFIETGILGSILFATSLYVQTVTDRIYRAALLADKQAGAIFDLQKLNNEIIERMRTGVVVNPAKQIVSMNSAARATLNPLLESQPPGASERFLLPEALREQLDLWIHNPKRQPQPITIAAPTNNCKCTSHFSNLKAMLTSCSSLKTTGRSCSG